MCGIFGFVSTQRREATIVLDGLRYLEYRGYDSWGVAVGHENGVLMEKATGAISTASTSLPISAIGLGHTRWATHGGVTQANAHPHADCSGRLALIHNGIVENHQELRRSLQQEHQFLSQTDTEVLVHLLEETLTTGVDLLTALMQVFRGVEGLSAVAVLDSETGQMAVAKNGSPLVLGWGSDGMYLASDPIALLDHTRQITFLEDGQAASLTPDGIQIVDLSTGRAISATVQEVTWDTHRAGLDGYAHFMDKEIHEQPRVLREIGNTKAADAERLAEMIRQAKDVFIIGCGTAHHAALSARYLLSEISGRNSVTAVASEMSLVAPFIESDSLVIAFSQSGETIDVLEAVKEARRRGATIAALVNAPGSALDRFADFSIHLDCGPERCVLATKSYTAKLAVMEMTAQALAEDISVGVQHLLEASHHVEALLDRELKSGVIRQLAQRMGAEQHIFVLGRHRNYPLALEAALKIKEVSYLHAEGFAAGELKHGVIALITYGTPCIVLAPDATFRREALAAASEVRARGAYVVGVSAASEPEFDVSLLTTSSHAAPYEIAAITQLLAYELALIRGCDPDKPRNLAKSVTVK